MQRAKIKTDIITLRIPPQTKQVIRDRAREAQMTVTSYMTICALGQKIVRMDGLEEVLAELKAQGRNLNQLTTLANMGKIKTLRGDDLVDGYAKLCELVSQLIKAVQ